MVDILSNMSRVGQIRAPQRSASMQSATLTPLPVAPLPAGPVGPSVLPTLPVIPAQPAPSAFSVPVPPAGAGGGAPRSLAAAQRSGSMQSALLSNPDGGETAVVPLSQEEGQSPWFGVRNAFAEPSAQVFASQEQEQLQKALSWHH